jgi:hypothetical protein
MEDNMDKNKEALKIFLSSFICLRKRNGVANLISGANANTIPICEGVYPISCNTLGIKIIYTATAAK